VLVWLHGGAWIAGSGSSDKYDGALLAREGDLVFVGVNYRLGALGWLHRPGIVDVESQADTIYGLAGGVWSKDEARAQKVARRMRAGQIDINGGAFNMNAPFGGFKQSGHGREAGRYGLEEFLEYKSLQLKG
jgi:hypothetical protein